MKDKIQNRINDYVAQLRRDTVNKKLIWRPAYNMHVVNGLKCKGIVLEATTNAGHRVFLYETADNIPTLEIPKTTATVWAFGRELHSFSVTSTEVDALYLDVIMPISSPERMDNRPNSRIPKLEIVIWIIIVLCWFAFIIFRSCS